ncbi:MAG: rhamnogalacturonan acetylesterase [Planctomycetales bacterium]|nr:rhamnogalacturonan acetylesterase [Planctomycetales bacterium]
MPDVAAPTNSMIIVQAQQDRLMRLVCSSLLLVTLLVPLPNNVFAQSDHSRENGQWSATRFEDIRAGLPTVFIASDSTAATGGPTTRGWGAVFADYLDLDRINVINRAVGGRSFRSFTREGRWDEIVSFLKSGDFVIIELGHNDGGGAQNSRGRGDVPGIGEETEKVIGPDGSEEIVHTYGWYLRKYIRDTKAKGATPIVSTTTVRNLWGDGHVERGMGHMRDWAEEVAKQEDAHFIDHSNLAADHYERVGQEESTKYHPQDHTHTNVSGAIVNAEALIAGLRAFESIELNRYLNAKGQGIQPIATQPHWGTYSPPRESQLQATAQARPDYGVDRRGRALRFPPGVEPGMPHPSYNPHLPTLWLIGDSTVKEGRDNGLNGGRWGWGHEIDRYFDLTKINVENQALGGTSSRSFITGGWWESVREMIKPGDFVMIQFGHNDGGLNSQTARIRARATLSGVGLETLEMQVNGETETVHTYGWYLRKYITEVRAAGATPIVCSLIPRNSWQNGTMHRSDEGGYAGWAREAAQQHAADFIDLNHIICDTLEPLRQDFVLGALFRPDDGTHTTLLGAQVNAYCVVAGIKSISENHPLHQYLNPAASSVEPARPENVVSSSASVR